VRAKQDRYQDSARKKVLPIQIHGDAAFSGQGVCFETLQMQSLRAYGTGGTIHIIINNQVGFTTSPVDSRSTPYSTDLAKMLDSPIFHVNGDDPEAVWHVARLAIEWRQKFGTDAFIDLVCYRKHGHNEGDEPSFTQPLLYKKIRAHTSTRELYGEALTRESILGPGEAQKVVDQVTDVFSEAQKLAKATPQDPVTSVFEGDWKTLKKPGHGAVFAPVKTAVPAPTLTELAEKINAMPSGFNLNSKLTRFFDARLKAVKEGKGLDWGNAEALAYASLLNEGHTVRITGQDAERGTFTHRHAVVTDSETGNRYNPQANVAQKGAKFEIYNSHLSETAAMGFEYGYAIAAPHALTVWEAQFGDFANGAQVIIDQFIATSESKWQRMNGLVLLLPHGYEGQGPEHSSARLERFLQLCGKENMSVVNLSTPAQIFHALRRQVKRDFRKPLIVMSPKSMLRHPMAISTLSDLSDINFQEVIDCPESSAQPEKVRRVLLCSGKVYYDLVNERSTRKANDVAIVRVEQLYPWPAASLAKILNQYSKAREVLWVQEEPRNMGAWSHVFNYWMGGLDLFMSQVGDRPIRYAGRGIASSPAVGSPKVHESELKAFLAEAFT
jgi:2-oxoglutarate dehydrogenase E1 component